MPEGQAYSARDTWAAESTKTGAASAANVRGTLAPGQPGRLHGRDARLQPLRHLRRRHIKVDDKTFPSRRSRASPRVPRRRPRPPDPGHDLGQALLHEQRPGRAVPDGVRAEPDGRHLRRGRLVLLATVGNPWGKLPPRRAADERPLSARHLPDPLHVWAHGQRADDGRASRGRGAARRARGPARHLGAGSTGRQRVLPDPRRGHGERRQREPAPRGNRCGQARHHPVRRGRRRRPEGAATTHSGRRVLLRRGRRRRVERRRREATAPTSPVAVAVAARPTSGRGPSPTRRHSRRGWSRPPAVAAPVVWRTGGPEARTASPTRRPDRVKPGRRRPAEIRAPTAPREVSALGGPAAPTASRSTAAEAAAADSTAAAAAGAAAAVAAGRTCSPEGRSPAAADDQGGAAYVRISYPSKYGPTLAQTLRRFGATPTLRQRPGQPPLGTPSWAQPDPSAPNYTKAPPVEAVEASASITPGATGAIQGVLSRGPRNMLVRPAGRADTPVVTSVNGTQRPPSTVNFGSVLDVISHAHASGLIPSGRPGEGRPRRPGRRPGRTSATGCAGARTSAWSTAGTRTSSSSGPRDQSGITNPGGKGFDDPTLAVVKKQMQVELERRGPRRGTPAAHAEPGKDSRTRPWTRPSRTRSRTCRTRCASPRTSRGSPRRWGSPRRRSLALAPLIIKALIGAAAAAASAGPIGAAIGVIGAVIGLIIALVSNALSKTGPDRAKVSAEQLAQEITRRFTEGLNSLGQAFDLIYDDWGKLARVGEGLRSGTGWDIRQDQVGLAREPGGPTRRSSGTLPDPAPLQRRAGPVGRRALGEPEGTRCYTKTQRLLLVQVLG